MAGESDMVQARFHAATMINLAKYFQGPSRAFLFTQRFPGLDLMRLRWVSLVAWNNIPESICFVLMVLTIATPNN
jgi:hypothetical protein